MSPGISAVHGKLHIDVTHAKTVGTSLVVGYLLRKAKDHS